MPLITIEQAVAAVRSFLDRSKGQQVYPSAPYWVERIVDAIRALPPAEPTEEEVERVTDALLPRHDYGDRKEAEEDARAACAAMKQTSGKER